MAQTQYLGDAENLADLESRIHPTEQDAFKSFGHTKIEAAFTDRLFVIYKPTGIGSDNQHRPPEVLTTVKVLGLVCTSRWGAEVEVVDLTTGEKMVVGYVPRRLFNFDVFVSIPPFMRLRYDARVGRDGVVRRTLSFALLIKTKNRASFYSFGVHQAETPNKLRELYPHINHSLSYI